MEKNNQIIIYEDFAGYPYQASFYGNQWWVTTPGEILQPLPKLFGKENIDICFACYQGGHSGRNNPGKDAGQGTGTSLRYD